jgi:hypothetical protein
MIRDPVYREAVKHRQATIEDSRLIRLAPVAAGAGFGLRRNAGASAEALPVDLLPGARFSSGGDNHG